VSYEGWSLDPKTGEITRTITDVPGIFVDLYADSTVAIQQIEPRSVPFHDYGMITTGRTRSNGGRCHACCSLANQLRQ
jgi:hypothetical protein